MGYNNKYLSNMNDVDKERLKKHNKSMIKIIIVLLLIIITALSYGVHRAFYDMARLPKGVLIAEVQSPDGKYTLKAYKIDSSLSASAIRGELNYNNIKKKPKNLYWHYREDSVNIGWADDVTVIINGHHLNVLHDTYDWRREE